MKARIRETARRLWTLYVALTLLQVATPRGVRLDSASTRAWTSSKRLRMR